MVKELPLNVFPLWKYWTSSKDRKNALRNKNTHYVIIDASSAYFILIFFRTRSMISREVDDIFQFWKVICTLHIRALSTAYDFSWHRGKWICGCYWKKEPKDSFKPVHFSSERIISVCFSVLETLDVVKESKKCITS